MVDIDRRETDIRVRAGSVSNPVSKLMICATQLSLHHGGVKRVARGEAAVAEQDDLAPFGVGERDLAKTSSTALSRASKAGWIASRRSSATYR